MAADPWADLTAELDAWAAAGRAASFWWRDDDATAPSPALDRLLGRAEACGVPLALAVIPATAGPALGDRLATAPAGIRVLVHGWSHGNHARPDKKKSELACGRPMAEMTADLARGRARLDELFGPRLLPVLTPPWNRLPVPLIRELPAIGINGLSRFKPRKTRSPAPGVVEVNTHIDPIDWHGGRGFTGEVAALGEVAAATASGSSSSASAASRFGR